MAVERSHHRKRISPRIFVELFPALLILFLSLQSPAQQLAKRLILKDGSYQLITKYEIQGERVHYFSAERSDWEDLPYSMVDWDATAKFEKDRAAGAPTPEAVQLDKETTAEREAEQAKSPEVAPGLRLPVGGGILLLDTFQSEPELVELQENNAELNRDTKHNVVRAAIDPLAKSKQTIELEGLHSKTQAHVVLPSIYVKLERDADAHDASPPEKGNTAAAANPKKQELLDRYRIIRLQPKQDVRIVGNIKVAVYGKVGQQQDFVPARVEKLTGGWAKITPSSDLTSGEYAVVEMIDQSQVSSALWDFGVNPSAPANSWVLKPEVKPNSNQPIELHQRKPN